MAAVMPRKNQDLDSEFPPVGAEKPAPDWVERFFARADPGAEFDAANALAESAERTLLVSIALARGGRAIDLHGLENWIGRLTASALDLDPGDGRRLRPALVGLLHCLDTLEEIVRSSDLPRKTG
jgi:hypothetical protein